jgi:hypothetical protein
VVPIRALQVGREPVQMVRLIGAVRRFIYELGPVPAGYRYWPYRVA